MQHSQDLGENPTVKHIDSLTKDPATTGHLLAQLTRTLLRCGDSITARRVMDAAIERGGDEVARLATFTEKREGIAYGRMRLILGTTPTDKCFALCDLGVLDLIKGDVSGAREMFRRAVSTLSTNKEASLWFHLLDRWGEHLSQFFTMGRPLPTKVADRLSMLLPDASNGYQSPIRQLSRVAEPTTKAA